MLQGLGAYSKRKNLVLECEHGIAKLADNSTWVEYCAMLRQLSQIMKLGADRDLKIFP